MLLKGMQLEDISQPLRHSGIQGLRIWSPSSVCLYSARANGGVSSKGTLCSAASSRIFAATLGAPILPSAYFSATA